MTINRTDLTWMKFKELVEQARGHWRVSERETAVSVEEGGYVTRYVKKVIIPSAGPAFVADTSTNSGLRAGDHSDVASVAAHVVVHAVEALPALAEESERARALLAQLVPSLPTADRERVEMFLAEQTYADRYNDRNKGGW